MRRNMNDSQTVARQNILGTVERQLLSNDPPEAKETYNRLRAQGYDDKDAKRLIGSAISTETFMILKHGESFDRARYVATLRNLPRLHA